MFTYVAVQHICWLFNRSHEERFKQENFTRLDLVYVLTTVFVDVSLTIRGIMSLWW